jgi:hypothetical protein
MIERIPKTRCFFLMYLQNTIAHEKLKNLCASKGILPNQIALVSTFHNV